MGLTFARFAKDSCCLCGSTDGLTGEHKVKASAIRSEFGAETMVIGRVGEPDGLRVAQGPKSKEFHFGARVCGTCNSTATQAADLEFDRFHGVAKALLAAGRDLGAAFDDPRYLPGSPAYLNVFRYFAKLLCCHMAEVEAPRHLLLSRFALAQSSRNYVWLSVDEDWSYRQISSQFGPQQYAAHGGLVVYGDPKSGLPNAFHSTLTIGAIRYVFFSRLNWIQQLEIRVAHPVFRDWCRQRVEQAKSEPLTEAVQFHLGLAADDARAQSMLKDPEVGPNNSTPS